MRRPAKITRPRGIAIFGARRAYCLAAALAGLAVGVAGCAVPLALSVATSVAQIAITAATGKGPSDHLLSAAMMEDCVLFRVLDGEEICIETPEDALIQRPDGVYLKVEHADGSREVAPVTSIQPVHAYSEMPASADAQQVIDVIRGSRPSPATPGVVYGEADDLPVVH